MWVITAGLVLALVAEQMKTQGLEEEVERITKRARNAIERPELSLPAYPLLFISSASPSSPQSILPTCSNPHSGNRGSGF
jgi:hypothetical protein